MKKQKPQNDIWTLIQGILIAIITILLYLGYQSDLKNQKILEENYYNVPFDPVMDVEDINGS